VADITYLIFYGQKLYLSAIKDLYNNEIVACHISQRNDIKLVIHTLKKAIKKRNVNGLLLDSDQGFQYTIPPIQQSTEKIQYKGQYVQERELFGQCLYGKLLQPFQGRVFSSVLFPYNRRGKGCRTPIYSFL
jgi:putative transposase